MKKLTSNRHQPHVVSIANQWGLSLPAILAQRRLRERGGDKGVGVGTWGGDRRKEKERGSEGREGGRKEGRKEKGPGFFHHSAVAYASLSLPASVFVAREAPGLKFRTENRPVSSRLVAENALPAIASRSRQGVAIRPNERGERKKEGEESAQRRSGIRGEARGARRQTDRRDLDSSPSCLSSARSQGSSTFLAPSLSLRSRFTRALRGGSPPCGVSIP